MLLRPYKLCESKLDKKDLFAFERINMPKHFNINKSLELKYFLPIQPSVEEI